jgi:type IV secretion system protein VirB11
MDSGSSASVEAYLERADREAADTAARAQRAPAPDRGAAVRELLRPLRDLLDRPDTTDVAINGSDEVWVENDSGWHRHPAPAITPTWLGTFSAVAATFNRHVIDEKRPLLSGVLPDGSMPRGRCRPSTESCCASGPRPGTGTFLRSPCARSATS